MTHIFICGSAVYNQFQVNYSIKNEIIRHSKTQFKIWQQNFKNNRFVGMSSNEFGFNFFPQTKQLPRKSTEEESQGL